MAGQLAGGQDEEGLPAYQDVGVVGVVVHLHHAPRQLQLQAGGVLHPGVADGFGFCRGSGVTTATAQGGPSFPPSGKGEKSYETSSVVDPDSVNPDPEF